MTTRRVVSVKIVLFAIGCNCILLASTDPKWQPEEILLWMLVCEFFFSALFLVECTIKVVAYGFCEYLSDSWNCLDFLVVLESLVSIIFEYGGLDFDLNLSILRVLRVLRPLRSVNKFPMLKNIINASLSSMALLKDIFAVFFAYLLIGAIIATTLWSGLLRYRCTEVDADGNVIHYSAEADDYHPHAPPYEPYEGNEDGELGLIPHEDSVCLAEPKLDKKACFEESTMSSSALGCEHGSSCLRREEYGNPLYGLLGFDNVAQAFINVFMICQFEDWDYLMVLTQAVSGEWVVVFYMITILTGACILVNLVVAAIMVKFREALTEIEEKKKESGGGEEGELLHSLIKEEKTAGGAPSDTVNDEAQSGNFIDQAADYEVERLKSLRGRGLLNEDEYKEGTHAIVELSKQAFELDLQGQEARWPNLTRIMAKEKAEKARCARFLNRINYLGLPSESVYCSLPKGRLTIGWKYAADEWEAGVDLKEAGLDVPVDELPAAIPVTGGMFRWLVVSSPENSCYTKNDPDLNTCWRGPLGAHGLAI